MGVWRLRELLLWEPLSPTRPRISLAPQKTDYKPEVPHFLIRPFRAYAGLTNRSPSSLECAFMGFRVAISLQQLSLSGSGMRCSQSPCSRPGPCAMLHWITVSRRPELREARVPAQDPASRGGLLSMQGLSPMGPASAWTHECSETCGEQGPETQSVQVDLCPKVPNTSALSQEPR